MIYTSLSYIYIHIILSFTSLLFLFISAMLFTPKETSCNVFLFRLAQDVCFRLKLLLRFVINTIVSFFNIIEDHPPLFFNVNKHTMALYILCTGSAKKNPYNVRLYRLAE